MAGLTLGIYIDLPGVWPLHCHIGWHLSEGKLAAIIYQPEAIKAIDQPDEWKGVRWQRPIPGLSDKQLCSAYGKDDIGPAKREITPFERDLTLSRRGELSTAKPFFRRRGPREN